ncbi:MAG: hypothetical protein V7K69_27770 [Nostoc sp.]
MATRTPQASLHSPTTEPTAHDRTPAAKGTEHSARLFQTNSQNPRCAEI